MDESAWQGGYASAQIHAFDLEAEEAILRAAMCGDYETVTYVTGYLEATDFYHGRHQQLFSAILEASKDHTSLDPVTLGAYVPESLKKAVRNLYENARRDTDNLQHWVRAVRNYAMQRRMLDLSADVMQRLEGPKWQDAMWEFYDGMVEIVAGQSDDGAKAASDMHEEIMSLVSSSMERQGVIGIRSGIWPIDMHFMGLCKGHVGILAGRPNEGKSGFAGQVMSNVARQDKRSLMVSTEMQSRDVYLRLAFAHAGVDWEKFTEGGLSATDKNAVDAAVREVGNLPMFVDDTDSHSIASIRRACIRHRPDFLVVDYLQQVRPPAAYRDSRDREVGSIADGIRSIAKMIDAPVLALAQMNRAIEGRNNPDPKLSDLRDSGVVENNADWVMFIQKAHTFDRGRPENEVVLKCRKNRHGARKVWDESMYLNEGKMWLGNEIPDAPPEPARSSKPSRAEQDGDDFNDLDFEGMDLP